MDEERMKVFKKEIQQQKEKEFCQQGHLFHGNDECIRCRKPRSEASAQGSDFSCVIPVITFAHVPVTW